MNVRRWATGAAVLVILAMLAVLIVHFANPSQPVAADDYKGHPASSTPTTQAPTAPAGTDDAAGSTGADGSAGQGVAGAGTDRSTASGASSMASQDAVGEDPAAPGDRPTWNPAADAPEGADQEPKVPNGLGTEPYRLPDSAERQPALTEVPDAAAAEHELVAGFPEHAVPVPNDVDIQSSSVATQGQRVFVGVNALSSANPEAVLDYYVRHCESLAWPTDRPTLDDGTPQVQCGFGPDVLTVTASLSSTGRVDLSVSGSFEVR
ncbi:hypothetical protein [Citricoccus alkalitolerans]|uniref:Secreted protein n=1 Tax=Citricoccus alkalitolerans TaxID=246603 RepID=A0ABV8Y1L6_9MICC